MSRVDVPTIKCDRCGLTTDDPQVMSTFRTLVIPRGVASWDLCTDCWTSFCVWFG